MMKNIKLMVFIILIGFLTPQLAWVKDREKEFEEEEIRKELEETSRVGKIDEGFLYDYGGWLRVSPYSFADQDQHRALRIYDGRLWLKGLIEKHNEFYVRVKTLVVDYNKGDSYRGDDQYLIKPSLDQGFYKMDLLNVLYDEKEAEMLYPKITLQLGRQFSSLGSGLIYNRVDDGVRIDMHFTGVESTIIAAQTIKSTNDIDSSRPNAMHSNRDFAGLQIDCTALGRHKPYLLFLIQHDGNKEEPDDPAQEYDYNSNYYGVGIEGAIIPRLQYTVESIKETGSSYPFLSNISQEKINAHANLVQLRYLPKTNLDPIFTLRYLYGSGDGNRGSVTNTVGGNRLGTNDNNFLYFGYALTGYVLEPKISNMQIYNLSVSVKPFKNKEGFEDTELGMGFYTYVKNKKYGAISDLKASLPKTDIGKEIDLFYNWKALSDFTISLRSGVFMPGNAYPHNVNDNSFFYNLNFTYSF